jgi:hypothetical protein
MMALNGSPETTVLQCKKYFSNELAEKQVQLNFNLRL